MPIICAVIPVLNEQGAIGPTVAGLPRDIVHSVIVVDGGSLDDTVAEARAAGATVLTELRRGYGRACLTGAEHAAKAGADIAVFLDGDGADATDHTGQLTAPLMDGTADFVLADRSSGAREPGSMGLHQLLAGRFAGLAVGAMTGVVYRDMCAFRAIRIHDLNRLGMRELGYGWNLEMQIRAARAGLRVREIALPYRCRIAGNSKVAGNWKGSLKAGQRIIRTLIGVGLTARIPAPATLAD